MVIDFRFTLKKRLMSKPFNMHAARTSLNQNPELRNWVEAWLKNKERELEVSMADDEFEKHWRNVRPERMHEGAMDALTAYAEGGNEIPNL